MTNEIENEVCLAESTSEVIINNIKNHNYHFIESFNKAAEIDLIASIATEITLDGTKSTSQLSYEFIIDTGKYTIRSNIRDLVKYVADEKHIKDLVMSIFGENYDVTAISFIEAITAGAAGGAFKYGLTGQNIYVGMINNILYELCNNYDSCSENSVNLAIYTAIVETSDVVAQEFIAAVTQDPLLAAAAGLSYYSKMRSIFAKTFYEQASTGLAIGGNIATAGEFIYTPNPQLASNLVGCISSYGNHSVGMNSTIDHAFSGLVSRDDYDYNFDLQHYTS